MAKMADLASGPTEESNAAAEAPVYKSTASLHSEDMKKMGMRSMAPGDHVEGLMHGVVSAAHEGGMTMHITHGAMSKAKQTAAEKMYGGAKEPDADDK